MKKTLIALSCVVLTAGALAQGTINFRNVNSSAVPPVDARVNRSDDATAAGRLGTGYWAQLYVGLTADSLAAVGVPVQFQVNATSGAPLGQVNGGTVTVASIAPGAQAVVQMRAWSGQGGAATYEAALASTGFVGVSQPITLTLGGAGSPPSVPANLIGLQAFTVVVPEPATIALGLLGAGALLLRRRK